MNSIYESLLKGKDNPERIIDLQKGKMFLIPKPGTKKWKKYSKFIKLKL